jgi:hypothetical protein
MRGTPRRAKRRGITCTPRGGEARAVYNRLLIVSREIITLSSFIHDLQKPAMTLSYYTIRDMSYTPTLSPSYPYHHEHPSRALHFRLNDEAISSFLGLWRSSRRSLISLQQMFDYFSSI